MADIRIPDEFYKKILTLPRNEAGYSALISTLKIEYNDLQQQFIDASKATVFNEKARTKALVLYGNCEALADVINLLERQLVIERGQ